MAGDCRTLAYGWVMSECSPSISLSCVVDAHPRFHIELILWLICVRRHMPANFRPSVYQIGEMPEDLSRWIGDQGVRIEKRNAMVPGSPHSNKIAPFFDDHQADFVVVTDTDLFMLADFGSFLTSQRFRAAPNNHCNPPAAIFKSVLSAAGFDGPFRAGVSLFPGHGGIRETHINNISAGIVTAPRERAGILAAAWKKWATWLVENRGLLDLWAVHVDQVAFALAMEELGEDVDHLPPQTNTILHLLPEVSTLYAVHLTTGHIPLFPHLFRPGGTIITDGLHDGVTPAIDRLNVAIAEAADVIRAVPCMRDHADKFLNPSWDRAA